MALTHGHIVVRGNGEAQQQFWPLAAQLVGLVLGLQLHLCRMTGEAACAASDQCHCPPVTRAIMMAVTASVSRAGTKCPEPLQVSIGPAIPYSYFTPTEKQGSERFRLQTGSASDHSLQSPGWAGAERLGPMEGAGTDGPSTASRKQCQELVGD